MKVTLKVIFVVFQFCNFSTDAVSIICLYLILFVLDRVWVEVAYFYIGLLGVHNVMMFVSSSADSSFLFEVISTFSARDVVTHPFPWWFVFKCSSIFHTLSSQVIFSEILLFTSVNEQLKRFVDARVLESKTIRHLGNRK